RQGQRGRAEARRRSSGLLPRRARRMARRLAVSPRTGRLPGAATTGLAPGDDSTGRGLRELHVRGLHVEPASALTQTRRRRLDFLRELLLVVGELLRHRL